MWDTQLKLYHSVVQCNWSSHFRKDLHILFKHRRASTIIKQSSRQIAKKLLEVNWRIDKSSYKHGFIKYNHATKI